MLTARFDAPHASDSHRTTLERGLSERPALRVRMRAMRFRLWAQSPFSRISWNDSTRLSPISRMRLRLRGSVSQKPCLLCRKPAPRRGRPLPCHLPNGPFYMASWSRSRVVRRRVQAGRYPRACAYVPEVSKDPVRSTSFPRSSVVFGLSRPFSSGKIFPHAALRRIRSQAETARLVPSVSNPKGSPAKKRRTRRLPLATSAMLVGIESASVSESGRTG